MATYVLQAVGSSIAGPLGGTLGAILGGVIDSAIFGPGDQEGPRLTDLNVTTSTYGAPIPLVYGPENRIAGNVIWSTDLIETAEESGGKGGGPTVTTYSYRVSLAVMLSGRELAALKRIFANGKVIYDAEGINAFSPPRELPAIDPADGQVVTRYYEDDSVSPPETVERGTHVVFDQLTFYPGNATQEPDPLIESFEGVGEVPGYRHTAYVVIKDLQLADFGNRIPNFEFDISGDESISVGAVAKDIFSRGNIENVSTFGLTEELRGYTIGRQSPIYAAMVPMEIAYDFEVSDQVGQLRCIRRARGPKGSIEIGQTGVTTTPSGNPNPIEFTTTTEVGLPDEVSITFKDPAIDYQLNTQKAYRREGQAVNIINQELPIVLTAPQARQIAERVLWGAQASRNKAATSLSDRWAHTNPGDIFGLPIASETLMFKATRWTRGHSGVIEMEFTYEDFEVYNSNAVGAEGTIPAQNIRLPGDTLWVPMDAPLLRDQDNDTAFYWAATGASDGWRGAEIKRSSDGGLTFAKISDVAVRNPIGTVTGVLGSGNTVVLDEANTLTVTLTHDSNTLESVSELNVLNGANAAWVGPGDGGEGEVLQFRDATLIAPLTYELTGLLRGRKGTEHKVDNHSAGELFVFLRAGTMGQSDFGANDWNKERDFKPVSFLNDELATDAQQFTNTGVRAKPLSPVHVEGERDSGDDLLITWVRRTRLSVPGLGNGPVPLGEASEAYEVDIIVGGSVVRTIETTSPTATYTATEQTADGITPGDPVTMDVFQLSELIGRGYAKRATV